MYALEIVPFSSLVTSINPSQSHSSSWITSTHYLSQFMTSVSLKNHPFCHNFHSKYSPTNLILAEADGESMTPHKLSYINFLVFHLLRICTNWSNTAQYLHKLVKK